MRKVVIFGAIFVASFTILMVMDYLLRPLHEVALVISLFLALTVMDLLLRRLDPEVVRGKSIREMVHDNAWGAARLAAMLIGLGIGNALFGTVWIGLPLGIAGYFGVNWLWGHEKSNPVTPESS